MGNFLGTVDATLTDAFGQVTDYFTANLPVVIGLFIAIAGVMWFLGIGFRSAGIKNRKKVG